MTRLLALYPAALAALLLALPLIAPRTGPLVLANIFSVHLALAALLLVPVAIASRGRALAMALAGLAFVAAARFGGEWVSTPAATSDGPFATASWNLELGARSGADAVDVLRTIDVDVIALQELGPDHARAIEASESVTDRYPHRVLHPEGDASGMGVLSRHPVLRAEFDRDPSVIEAVLATEYGDLTIIDAHPLHGRIDMAGSVPVGLDTTNRDERLGRIRTRVVDAIGRGESLILLGDLNTTPFEPGYLELADGLHDAHAEVGQGPGWTWRPSSLEWAGLGLIRIDHALSSPRVVPLSSTERCALVGDHCILEVRYSAADADGRFDIEFPAIGDIAPLPVRIEDRTGRVVSVEPRGPGQVDAVVRDPGRADTLLVTWMGGICDRAALVAIAPVGPAIRVAVKSEPTCGLLAGVERTVAVRFSGLVDPSLVTVELVS